MSHFIYFHSSRPYVSLIQVNQITRVKQDPVNWLVSQLAKSVYLSLSVTPDKTADSELSTGLLFKFCTIQLADSRVNHSLIIQFLKSGIKQDFSECYLFRESGIMQIELSCYQEILTDLLLTVSQLHGQPVRQQQSSQTIYQPQSHGQ